MEQTVRAGEGSWTGLRELVDARGLALTRFAYALCGDAQLAQDLVQEALTKVHQRWHAAGAPEHPEAYVRQVITRVFLTARRRRAGNEPTFADPAAEAPAADGTAERAERDHVWAVLAGLPPRQRAVLVLRYYEDLDDRTIAAVLGCATGTVRSAASRAFEVLRSHPEFSEGER